jgi:hypothetical protein
MSGFQRQDGDWTRFRGLPDLEELDLHFSERERGPRTTSYSEAMANVYELVLSGLEAAYRGGSTKYLLITHGHSTSRPGQTTARSQVRRLMRSSDATPYIVRKNCIQHCSVFVAAIRQQPSLE